MPTQTLSPAALVPDGSGLDLSAQLAAPAQTTLQFANSGREILLVKASATGVTVQVNVGTTVLGQSVSPFSAVTLTSGDLYAFGPFHSVLDAPGTNTITVTLSGTANVTVALVQFTGVY